MIKAGIIGSTGYAGVELVRLLTQHKEAEVVWYGSRSYIDKKYYEVFQNMFQIVDDKCLDDNMDELAKQVDVIFTATPQGLCASLVNEDILSKVKIIDLSADFRIKDVSVYEKWYGIEHKSPQFIDEAVYGLCEINRDKVKNARLIANPGCYPTCSTLSIYPMVKEGLVDVSSIIIDAKSGTSGAGRGAKVNNLFCEVNENIKAYGVATHRHTPEIEEQLLRFKPGLRGKMHPLASASMLTFRDWLSGFGAAYGIRQKMDQHNLFGRLPVRNFYTASQSSILPGAAGSMLTALVLFRQLAGEEIYRKFITARLESGK